MRQTRLEVNLTAIEKNAQALKKLASPALLCCVVKADAEAHGIVQASQAAIKGGSDWLGIALVEEAVELREGGAEFPSLLDVPILMLSEPRLNEMDDIIENTIRPTLYTEEGLVAFVEAISARDELPMNPYPVHLKVDTGMHRVGESPEKILSLALTIINKDGNIGKELDRNALEKITLESVWTHLAASDDPSNSYNQSQFDKYDELLKLLKAEGWDAQDSVSDNVYENAHENAQVKNAKGNIKNMKLRHAANSGGLTILQMNESPFYEACYDMVRVGLCTYGVHRPVVGESSVGQGSDNIVLDLTPAMSLISEVRFCKKISAGSAVSYGLRHTFDKDTQIAVIPIGYADGLRRDYGFVGGEVLIGGSRHSIVGAVTMDQIIVECNPEADVKVSDEVILIGKQGQEEITVVEIAEKLGTIPDEIMCSIGKRVRREYVERI